MSKRVILIVLDSVGAGELPDSGAYGDKGASTLLHTLAAAPQELINMRALGLYKLLGLEESGRVIGAWGRMAEQSAGKDTTTGHWELTGLKLETPFPTFPNGFPKEVTDALEKAWGVGIIGNNPASGTKIIEELGDEHLRTGKPIVYTSADSVLQIACHESLYPDEKLYEMCRQAREIMQSKYGVGRIIARPFNGKSGSFARTAGRRDFSLEPPEDTLLDEMKAAGKRVMGIGKIEDIFALRGLTDSDHAVGNPACMKSLLCDMEKHGEDGLIFVNLVDFDMQYGHRRDAKAYSRALKEFDDFLPTLEGRMTDGDILMITADHGCDPTFKGTDHTREYVPIMCLVKGKEKETPLGIRKTYADAAQTIAEYFSLKLRRGLSFLGEIL
ncbi:MAG: phosphopentomutase [Eubacteriales bacterium]|nr:phosphopentomutase [Eubacteriales bacterium]MDD3880845.1 phosphopentomutase [Eubacteriales bacterium]MDD4511788.1 phosphopentomutase [Eubacteriales bacterium]